MLRAIKNWIKKPISLVDKYKCGYLAFFGSIFTVVLFMNLFLCQIAFVRGSSMEPTLYNWDCVFVSKIPHQLEYGDIVVTNAQNPFGQALIKRVIALPGQHVILQSAEILVDGRPLAESYCVKPGDYMPLQLIVPADNYFLLGDNRDHSKDSREIGCIPKSQIIGRVVIRIFTLSNFQ